MKISLHQRRQLLITKQVFRGSEKGVNNTQHWPLQYQCSPLLVELSGLMRSGPYVGRR